MMNNALLNIALAATAVAPNQTPATTAADALPAEWVMGDFGIPVSYGDETLYFYADPVNVHGQIARSIMVVSGFAFIHPIVNPTGESFYWITDAVEQADGSLLVAALEVETPEQRNDDGWDFEITDTDMFVVRDPLSPASWNVASHLNKIEDGWWDGGQVEFSDQHPGLAFTRDPYCGIEGDCRNEVIEYDVTAVQHGERVAYTPESDGPFAPVQTADGWIGVAWDFLGNSATTWTTDNLSGQWEPIETIPYDIEVDGQTHAHGLNVIDGEVVHRWSTLRQRPSYEVIDA